VRYSHSAPEESADVVSLRVSAIGRLSKPALPEIARGSPEPPVQARKASRTVVFAGHGEQDTAVYDRTALLAGNVIVGPAVIEEAASTTVVEPGDQVTVNQYGHLVMQLGVPR
jgi:N-methylhydantoinase A